KEEVRQEQERYNLRKALELQRQLDQRKENVPKGDQAKEIDWNDPQVLRYHSLQNKPFSKAKDQVHTFIPKDSELEREVMKRARFDLQQGSLKKQRLDQQTEETEEEPEAQRDQEKIVKEGKISTYHITRADGSTRRYTLMINLLKNIDREDLETLWKLVKDKYGNTRPKEGYERVLWGDLKVMFELNIKSEVWRKLQGHEVSVWKSFSSCRVHFIRFKNRHIFLLVDKVYPLTPATIKMMLQRKLQADQWNERCY
nr:hypothetical protein [Tanacetum cinerariifolium]